MLKLRGGIKLDWADKCVALLDTAPMQTIMAYHSAMSTQLLWEWLYN